MKKYKVTYFESSWEDCEDRYGQCERDFVHTYLCQAEGKPHAKEQCLNANPYCRRIKGILEVQ